jgi:GT2 family glycosyltransferase
LDLKPKNIYAPKIEVKNFKTNGKVAIIIPTKGKLDLLFECIESFYEHCDTKIFDIFIADTGSTEEEIKSIEELVSRVENIKLIKYDYYNFAKINNDVVKNYINNTYEFLLFCNNDIKLLNDVITGMLSIFKTQPKVGTVGTRLHFEDNTIQHLGVEIYINSKNVIGLTHTGLGGYYSYPKKNYPILGNTGGLLMIRKFTFEKCGMFNENYISCLEDVELNLKSIILGLNNYICSECVAYHYESQTRNDDIQKIQKFQYDFKEVFLPFLNKNLNKVGKFIKNVQF